MVQKALWSFALPRQTVNVGKRNGLIAYMELGTWTLSVQLGCNHRDKDLEQQFSRGIYCINPVQGS
jgi:hypothetical protein